MMKYNKNKIIPTVFLSIGLFALIAAIAVHTGMKSHFNKYLETGIKTVAHITEISRTEDNNTAYVTFATNDSIEITSAIPYYSSGMYVGMPVEIYYDPANPRKFVLADRSFMIIFPLICGGIGVIFFLIGYIWLKKERKFTNRKNMLISGGRTVIADVIDMNINHTQNINGKSPLVVHARYTENGKIYVFKSHNIWLNPSQSLNTKVTVYVDYRDYGNYYIDEESLIN